MQTLPETGFLRITHILGNPKTNTPPIIPVSKSTWWAGVGSGRFPKPIKLSPGVTVWRVKDIRALIDSFDQEVQGLSQVTSTDSSSTHSQPNEACDD